MRTLLFQQVLDQIDSDFFRVFGHGLDVRTTLCGLLRPGLRYTVFFRLAHHYPRLNPIGLVSRLLMKGIGNHYGFQIPAAREIGAGFYIGHSGTIVINSSATIGTNCNLTHNVTIGQVNRGPKQGSPIIGNNVWIGTGATIVGNVEIGDNTLIAPNTYVNFDVPRDSLVIGNPGVIHKKSSSVINGYIQNQAIPRMKDV